MLMELSDEMETVAERLRYVLSQLYGQRALKPCDLEYDLAEMCSYLNVQMPRKDLNITRKQCNQ